MSFLKHLLGNLLGGHHGNNRRGGDHHSGYYNSSTPTQACPQCRAPQAGHARFCDNCGASLLGATCACGSVLAPGTKFCAQCGKAQ